LRKKKDARVIGWEK